MLTRMMDLPFLLVIYGTMQLIAKINLLSDIQNVHATKLNKSMELDFK